MYCYDEEYIESLMLTVNAELRLSDMTSWSRAIISKWNSWM